jgi:acyl carrier protein
MSDIKQVVKEYVADNLLMGRWSDDIADDSSFLDIGVLDSTGVVELVSFLEKTFAIEVLDEEMVPENLDSLGNIEQYVAAKLR